MAHVIHGLRHSVSACLFGLVIKFRVLQQISHQKHYFSGSNQVCITSLNFCCCASLYVDRVSYRSFGSRRGVIMTILRQQLDSFGLSPREQQVLILNARIIS